MTTIETLSDVTDALCQLDADAEAGDLATVCRALAQAIELDDGLWDAVCNGDALEALANALKAIGKGD